MRAYLLLAGALLTLSLGAASAVRANSDEALPILDGIGGDFAAPSSLGHEVRTTDYRGKVVLLFFGYTSCQDVCPVTLAHLDALVGRLGTAAEGVQVLFVTVDPETDTAETLATYLAQFDSRFVGLTGTPEQINRIAALYMAEHHRTHDVEVSTEYHRSKSFTEKSYLYTHAQQIYLLDGDGRTRGLFFSGSPLPEMERAVRSLLAQATDGAPCDVTSGCDSKAVEHPANPPLPHHDRDTEENRK